MSGWSVMTVSPPKSLSRDARDVANEKIESFLENEYGEGADGYGDRTVQLPRGTATYTEGEFGGTEYAETVFDGCPSAKWIVIVDANDTSDSGAAEVYKIEDGRILGVDTFVGYEGAKGRDVVGMVDDEYGLLSYCSWEA
jgi:hypothetical protein